MKGSPRLIVVLNDLLGKEVSAISQYVIHAGMAERWGYSKYAGEVMKRAIEEMKHADSLVDRILLFDGLPEKGVIDQPKVQIGKTLCDGIRKDLGAEDNAVRSLQEAIEEATSGGILGGEDTATLLRSILKDEVRHAQELEAYLLQEEQMGEENFLSTLK